MTVILQNTIKSTEVGVVIVICAVVVGVGVGGVGVGVIVVVVVVVIVVVGVVVVAVVVVVVVVAVTSAHGFMRPATDSTPRVLADPDPNKCTAGRTINTKSP